MPHTVLYGPSTFDYGTFSGYRLTIGGWLDADQRIGVEGRGFLLEQKTSNGFSIGDVPSKTLFAVPFFDLATGTESSFLTNSAIRQGTFAVNSSNRLWGAEANGLYKAFSNQSFSVAALAGFRYLDLSEKVDLMLERSSLDVVPFQGNLFGPGSIISSVDNFHTRNQFYGGQLGARAIYTYGKVFAQVDAKVALGDTHQAIGVNGLSTLTMVDGTRTTASGGLFAGPSRMGHFTADQFSVVPEGEFKVGYNVTNNVMVSVGYSFLYWSDVVRPGNQVNRNIDTREIPTSFNFVPGTTVNPQPPSFQHSDFWSQGVNFGLTLRF
jgi:hypothetical protein